MTNLPRGVVVLRVVFRVVFFFVGDSSPLLFAVAAMLCIYLRGFVIAEEGALRICRCGSSVSQDQDLKTYRVYLLIGPGRVFVRSHCMNGCHLKFHRTDDVKLSGGGSTDTDIRES